MCKENGVTSSLVRLRKLPRYCAREVALLIKILLEYISYNYARLKKALLRDYELDDRDQQLVSRLFLERLVGTLRTEKDDLRKYTRQYTTLASQLV